jgi:signal transduction histidine kinase
VKFLAAVYRFPVTNFSRLCHVPVSRARHFLEEILKEGSLMHDNAPQQFRPATRGKASLRVLPLRPVVRDSPQIPVPSSVPAPLFGREVLDQAFLALQDQLQTISKGLDLLQAAPAFDSEEYERMTQATKRAERVLQELREYASPPELCLSTENLAKIVEDLVQEATREWERPGRQTRVLCHAPLAALRLDWQQVGKVLERIIACAYALLPPEGGEVVVEAGLRKVGVQQYVDLKVRSCGAAPLAVEEGAVFQPFWQVNGYQFGLSLALVQRLVNRQHGQIFFQKTGPRQSYVTLLFRAWG